MKARLPCPFTVPVKRTLTFVLCWVNDTALFFSLLAKYTQNPTSDANNLRAWQMMESLTEHCIILPNSNSECLTRPKINIYGIIVGVESGGGGGDKRIDNKTAQIRRFFRFLGYVGGNQVGHLPTIRPPLKNPWRRPMVLSGGGGGGPKLYGSMGVTFTTSP